MRLIWGWKQWKLLFSDSAITILSLGIWTFLMLIRGADTFQYGTISKFPVGEQRGIQYWIFNITFDIQYYITLEICQVFGNIQSSPFKFSFWEIFTMGGGLWSKEIAELGQTRNCSQQSGSGFARRPNLISSWKLCLLWSNLMMEESPCWLLFVGRKKVFANQGSWWWGSRMIGRDYLIVGLFSGSSDCRIISD